MPTKNLDGDGADQAPDGRRRRFLGYAALATLAGTGIAGAWYVGQSDEPPDSLPTPTESTPSTTTSTDPIQPTEEAPAIVNRYAPDLYFGALEKWYPTDPRNYISETANDPVVDGFTALSEYSTAFDAADAPPDPTVFYNVVEAADGVDAIQYWLYSVFDQFTVNFHWHDWELLQVFIDRETGSPLLLSASAHSRASPNNEFLEPDVPEDRGPGILSEVGSHSSASEVNGVIPSFERIPTEDWHSDVTNDILDITQDVVAPFAYGLPRDEGARLPFVMPELDGHRLDQYPALSVAREDFVDERVTVDAWRGLPRPPTDLPLREAGIVITHPDSPTTADATYELKPISSLRGVIEDFVGPQLSFEFVIPGFAENQFASHITSVGIPWKQDRFEDPLDDVTDPAHRQRIDGNSPSGLMNRVVGRVRHLRSGSDGALGRVTSETREVLEAMINVSLFRSPVEVAVRLSSEAPVATVTRDGVFGYLHVDSGEHLLVINGPGLAPLAERFVHEGGLARAGAEGELTVVSNEDVGWIRGDGQDTTGIAHVRVIEDYAGVVYDGRPVDANRFAVAVHREGRYTVEIVDQNGRSGAYRVTPASFDDASHAVRDRVETGKAQLAGTLRDEIREVGDVARVLGEQDDAGREVIDRLSRAQEEASEAIRAANRDDERSANEWLSTVITSLEETLQVLSSERQSGYSDASAAVLESRVREAIERAETAIETELA